MIIEFPSYGSNEYNSAKVVKKELKDPYDELCRKLGKAVVLENGEDEAKKMLEAFEKANPKIEL